MKLKLLMLISAMACGMVVFGQSAEENTRNGYVQNYPTYEDNDNNNKKVKVKDFTYNFKGNKFNGNMNEIWWSGNTAVMNSSDGSFQVLFSSKPTSGKTYGIKEYADASNCSISLIADNDQNFYFSKDDSGGSVKVTVKGNKTTIEVKNVNVCQSFTTNCGKISGKFTLDKY